MKKRALITTVFSGEAIKLAVTKLSPDKIIFLPENPLKEKTKEDLKKEQTINELKKVFKDVLEIDIKKTSPYELPEIIKDSINIIDNISEDFDIILHITEGRKITSLGLLFAGYLRKEKILGAYYIIEENNTLLSLPLINFSLNKKKKEILLEIKKGIEDKEEIGKKVGLCKSAVYQNIQELKKDNYITNETGLKITDLGRIMVI